MFNANLEIAVTFPLGFHDQRLSLSLYFMSLLQVGTGRSGPYSQLTREELIALLLKQESQHSERDKKISELEQYIDNLLVRVMEENPSILMSMSSLKKSA